MKRTLAETTGHVFRQARRQGWMLGGTEQQRAEWQDECSAKGVDWLVVTKSRKSINLACLVHPSHQLSDLAYLEISQLFARLGWQSGSLGMDYRGNASQFEATVPSSIPLEELVKDVQEILRYDRTSRRLLERQPRSALALAEGMAVALDSTGLWESHEPHHRVYVMELEGKPGRCLVLKHLHPVLVDFPLSSFQILAEVDA
jgi:hypothetical protein